MKKIEISLLDYLDVESNIEEKYQNIKNDFIDMKIQDDKYKLKLFLYLLAQISNYHYRCANFFDKIEKIILYFKGEIKKYYSNSELFHIFNKSKRILLFLFEENLIIFNESIAKTFFTEEYFDANYLQYFLPEIKPYINEKWALKYAYNEKYSNILKEETPTNFYENRKISENDELICKIIRKDLIEDFIIYVNKNQYSLNSTINPSIYETNLFLTAKKIIKLVDYTVFYGSNQIFNYLTKNGAQLNQGLLKYAIHGQNAEIFHILEEIFQEEIKQTNKNLTYYPKGNLKCDLYKLAIKCHHNDFANYIYDNYLLESEFNTDDFSICCIQYYNFIQITNDIINESSFYYICKYDNYILANILLKEINVDINKKTIFQTIFNTIQTLWI